MKRGDIYYIKKGTSVGSEIAKGRPGIIVSHDALNATSEVVEVVFLTTRSKREIPTHVQIQATGCTSTALCEQVNSVSKLRLGARCGTCTVEEMRAIDTALRESLDLIWTEPKEPEAQPQKLSKGEEWLIQELGKIQAERDRYARMLDVLLKGGQA